MRAYWVLTLMRMRDVLRNPASTAFVLFFPVVLMLLVGWVFSDGHPFERRVVLVVGTIPPPLAARADVRVVSAGSEVEATARLRASMADAAIVDGHVLAGPRAELFARGLAALVGGGPLADITRVETPRFGYVHYLFPGILAFSLLISGLFGTGYTLAQFRANGFLRKLAVTPSGPLTFVAAQATARSILALTQVVLLTVAARLVFAVPLPSIGWLAAISVAGLLAFLGVGFLLASLIESPDLIADIINAVSFPLVFLSEIFFPLDVLPRALASAASWLPSTALVRLFRDTLLDGKPASLTGLPILLACAALTFALAALRRDRWLRR
jgi:ABC-type polysaccharide/polyol phosphate export permease